MNIILRIKQFIELGAEIGQGVFIKPESRESDIVTFDGRRVRVYFELLPHDQMIIYRSSKESREFIPSGEKNPLSEEQYEFVINVIANHFRKVGYKVELNWTPARTGPLTEEALLKICPHYKKPGYKIEKMPDGSIKVSFPRKFIRLRYVVIILLALFVLIVTIFLNYQ